MASVEFTIAHFLALAGFLITCFGTWYKINQDVAAKIDTAKEGARNELSKVKADIEQMRASGISRQEHDRDIENVKAEIRTFRDEVRDDIRSLSTHLNTRFDVLLDRMLSLNHTSSTK